MSALYSDTHPKMEALQIQLWREASPTRKMHMLARWHWQVCVPDTQTPLKSSFAAGWQISYWEKNWRAKCMTVQGNSTWSIRAKGGLSSTSAIYWNALSANLYNLCSAWVAAKRVPRQPTGLESCPLIRL